jgi:hypothetical protein
MQNRIDYLNNNKDKNEKMRTTIIIFIQHFVINWMTEQP